MRQLAIIGGIIGICLGASIAKLAGVNQEVIDTGAILCALVMTIVTMVRVGRRIGQWK